MKAFMFVFTVALMLGLSSMAQAQEAHSTDITFDVLVGSVPLGITTTSDLNLDDGGVGTLTPGVAITAVPDGADAWLTAGTSGTSGTNPYQPNLGGQPGAFDVTGAPSAAVLVSFALPYVLYPAANGTGVVHVDYNGTSACYVDNNATANYFNPKNGVRVILNTDPSVPLHFNLGGIFTVDPTANADDYIGVAIVTVAYAANN